ncbi:hypothetical protein [Nocardia carnea]|uniref:hypothetical protein n=1 Tax=Nocardia carnea TaxID=37328 RepID=UPI00030894EC|nr:hypothetical protein [Nocardia carnea]
MTGYRRDLTEYQHQTLESFRRGDTEIDRSDVVAELWPVDGPHTVQIFAEATLALEHLVRYANHATLNAPADALPTPEDAARSVRSLGAALAKLPQLCDQLAARADRFAANPTLRADSTADQEPAVQAGLAAEALRELAAATAPLHRLTDAASAPLNTLWLDDEPT